MATFTVERGKRVFDVEAETQQAAEQKVDAELAFEEKTETSEEPAPEEERSVVDKLTGQGGERYQTWPERMVRGIPGVAADAVTAPAQLTKDYMEGKIDAQSPDAGARTIGPAAAFTPMGVASKIAKVGKIAARTPTSLELRAAAKKAYKDFRESGVKFTGKSIRVLAVEIEQKLIEKGILESTHPAVYDVVKRMKNAPPRSHLEAAGFDAMHRAFGTAAKDPAQSVGAAVGIKALERFIKKPPKESIVAGAPAGAVAKAQEAIKRARGNYAAYKREGLLTGRLESAELQAATANSGQNIGNTIRQRYKQIVDPMHPKRARGFNLKEKNAIEGVAIGRRPGPYRPSVTNASRVVGNLLGGGGGLGSLLTGGTGAYVGSSFGPAAAAAGAVLPPLTGAAAKKLSNALTKRAARKAAETVRQRSPLYEGRQAGQGVPQAVQPSFRHNALLRALLASGGSKIGSEVDEYYGP